MTTEGIEQVEIPGVGMRRMGLLRPATLVSALPRYAMAGPIWSKEQIVEAISNRTPRREIFGDGWIKDQNGRGACFPAGTKVTLASGELVNIEDIQYGHLVRTHLVNYR